MKRLIYLLMIFMLIFSVFAMNSICVFAEGEDTSGAEETVPEGDNEAAPDGEGETEQAPDTDEEKTESDCEIEPEQTTGSDDTESGEGDLGELSSLFGDLGASLTDLKDEFVGIVSNWIEFIKNDETYSSIAGIVLAVLAVIFVPILVAVLVFIYLIAAMVISIVSVLVGMVDVVVNLLARFLTI